MNRPATAIAALAICGAAIATHAQTPVIDKVIENAAGTQITISGGAFGTDARGDGARSAAAAPNPSY